MDTDRNLLFGVMAYHEDYLDLAQLGAICRAWAADKAKPIPQMLVERSWLAEQDRQEIERRVERKLKKSARGVQATLSSLANGEVREVLKSVDDPDVRNSVRSWPDGGHLLIETLIRAPESSEPEESRYTLTEVRGKGGLGRVWLAYDKQLNRKVALKELLPTTAKSDDTLRRFLAEAQVTSQLQHPNIVPVYDVDRRPTDQQPFYTMKLVQGRTLGDAIAEYHQHRQTGTPDAVELAKLLQAFISVCQALAYAHSRHVIHRDLKPRNIVLGDFGEVIVLDWGEAKVLGTDEIAPGDSALGDSALGEPEGVSTRTNNATTDNVNPESAPVQGLTPAGSPDKQPNTSPDHQTRVQVTEDAEALEQTIGWKGTPAYMAPEQAAGRHEQVDHRTDIYGLGAILFDILAGQPPHQLQAGERLSSHAEITRFMSRILNRPTPHVRELDATVPVSLDAVCAKAMSEHREVRYQSAADLAADVQRHLADEPVSVIRDPVSVRARRWMKRHQVAFASIAAMLLMSVVGLFAWGSLSARHTSQLEAEKTKLTNANNELTATKTDLTDANTQLTDKTNALTESNDQLTAANAKEVQARKESERQLRKATALRLASASREVRDQFPVRSVLLASASVEATNHFREPVEVTSENELRNALANIRGKLVAKNEHAITCAGMSADGRWLVTGGDDTTACVWDLSASDPAANPRILRGHEESLSCLALTPDGRWLATASVSDQGVTFGACVSTVIVWDMSAPESELSARRILCAGQVNCVTLSADGRMLLFSGSGMGGLQNGLLVGERVEMWDLGSSGTAISKRVLFGSDKRSDYSDHILCLSLSLDRRWLVTGSNAKTARVWDLSADDPAANSRILRGHDDDIICLLLSPDGRWLVTGSSDKTARVWDLSAADPTATARVLRGHEHLISCLSLSPDGRWLVTGSWDKAARIWDLSAADPTATARVLRGHESGITCLSMSSDGHWLVTGSSDQEVRLWDLSESEPIKTVRVIQKHDSGICWLAFSPDCRWIATASYDGTARVRDLFQVDSTAVSKLLAGHSNPVAGLAFSRDGHRLVTGGRDRTVRVWDMTASDPGKNSQVLRGHVADVDHLSLSEDGRRLVTSSTTQSFFSGNVTRTSGSPEHTVRVWDLLPADTGVNSRILKGHASHILCQALSADGRVLVTGSAYLRELGEVGDDSLRVWDLSADDPAATARVLRGHGNAIECMTLSADGRWLVTGSRDKTARVWDLMTDDPAATVRVLRGHESPITCLSLSRNGRWLVTGCAYVTDSDSSDTVRVWDLSKDDPNATVRMMSGHRGGVECLSVSPDGRWLVTGSRDRNVRVWDLSDPESKVHVLFGHEHWINCLAISSDSRWVVTGAKDNTARLWDLSASDPNTTMRVLRGHTNDITCLSFSPDGHWVATGSDDATVRIWDLRVDRLLNATRIVAGRDLSQAELKQYGIPDGLAKLGQQVVDPNELPIYFQPTTDNGPPNPEWHQTQIAAANQRRDWYAATFHHLRTDLSVPISLNKLEQRSFAFADQRLWDLVIRDCEQALNEPNAPTLWFARLVMASLVTGDFDKAGRTRTRLLRRFVDGDKKNVVDAQDFLWLSVHSPYEDFSKADLQVVSDAAIKAAEKNLSAALFFRIQNFVLTGEFAAAVQAAREAAEAKPPVPLFFDTRLALIRAHHGLEQTDMAKQLLDQVSREIENAYSPNVPISQRNYTWYNLVFGYSHLNAVRQLLDPDAKPLPLPLPPAMPPQPPTPPMPITAAIAESHRKSVGFREINDITEPNVLNSISWWVVRRSDFPKSKYEQAIKRAELACGKLPDNGTYLNTLGVAYYRAGQFQKAREALTHSAELNVKQKGVSDEGDLAFLAMSQHQLGDKESARETLAKLRELMQSATAKDNPEAQAFLREAESLIDPK